MTKEQEQILEKIEALIMRLSFSDKTNRAIGEIESLKTDLRHVERALSN